MKNLIDFLLNTVAVIVVGLLIGFALGAIGYLFRYPVMRIAAGMLSGVYLINWSVERVKTKLKWGEIKLTENKK